MIGANEEIEIGGITFAKLDEPDFVACLQIVGRAKSMGLLVDDVCALHMDLTALHHHTPLDFQKLANASDFCFVHDIGGIQAHMDRETGQLLNHFLPRCMRVAS
ncbi:MAG: hypothetical protein RJQ08_08555 [Salinisphaeraceae bacterium]